MTELIMPRRAFLSGMASLFAAPAIVKAANIMPVKVMPFDPYMLVRGTDLATGDWMEVRVYERSDDPFAFLSSQFHDKLLDASRMINISQTGVITNREEEKNVRMVEIFSPIKTVIKHDFDSSFYTKKFWAEFDAQKRRIVGES